MAGAEPLLVGSEDAYVSLRNPTSKMRSSTFLFLTATRVVLKRFSNWGGQMLGFGSSQQPYYLNSNSQARGCGSYSCAWNTIETCGVFWVPCAN